MSRTPTDPLDSVSLVAAMGGVSTLPPTPVHRPRKVIDASGIGRPIRGRYDAASDSSETRQIWANADALDADAANSLGVRKRLRERSRYEDSNNGYASGIVRTNANYTIGLGPKLRMGTSNPAFNAMVEQRWSAWCKATGFYRKLRTIQKAKDRDGEGFGILKTNPNVRDAVKLDLQLVECDQVTTPALGFGEEGKIDGLTFDPFGNVVDYDVLKTHPGSQFWQPILDPDKYPAEYVVHLYGMDRPGQHRGVPTATSTLNLFGTGRRYREDVLSCADTAADITVIMAMGTPDDGPDQARAMTSLPIEKRMAIVAPAGATPHQMKAEQPTTTYDGYNKAIISESARPYSMPQNIAMCDSSGYSFSGGQLDHVTYFVGVDVERQDCEDLALDKVFSMWFVEAVDVYGWAVVRYPIPKHSWIWPAKPRIDEEKTANARKIALSIGATTLTRIHDEDGTDYEEEIVIEARDYGVTVKEMRLVHLCANYAAAFTAVPQLFEIVAKPFGVSSVKTTKAVAAAVPSATGE